MLWILSEQGFAYGDQLTIEPAAPAVLLEFALPPQPVPQTRPSCVFEPSVGGVVPRLALQLWRPVARFPVLGRRTSKRQASRRMTIPPHVCAIPLVEFVPEVVGVD